MTKETHYSCKVFKPCVHVTRPESYDYIVHDVFTGGAEPIPLFTLEFLRGLDALLKEDGAIAIVRLPRPLKYSSARY